MGKPGVEHLMIGLISLNQLGSLLWIDLNVNSWTCRVSFMQITIHIIPTQVLFGCIIIVLAYTVL